MTEKMNGKFVLRGFGSDGTEAFDFEATEVGRQHPTTGLPYAVSTSGVVVHMVQAGGLTVLLDDLTPGAASVEDDDADDDEEEDAEEEDAEDCCEFCGSPCCDGTCEDDDDDYDEDED